MSKLVIKDLYAKVNNQEILKGVNLEVNSGEVHAIMGPNGTGKSTLSAVIMGNPNYQITSGEIIMDGKNVLEMEVDERAKIGLFLAMQYPSEISGITNSDFIRTAMNSLNKEKLSLYKYVKKLEKNIDELKMNKNMGNRYLNNGFSGGEKKRNEILQLKMLEPKIAILDEIDSGLDIDALTVVGENLTSMINEKRDLGLIMITHYQRLLNYINPTHVHVMIGGKIIKSGGFELAKELEKNGYEQYKEKNDLTKKNKKIIAGSCITKQIVDNNE